MLKRSIRRWLGLNQDSTYPHRLVTLMYWHDKIIGLDGNGDFWEVTVADYRGDFYVQLIAKNPLER